MKTNKNDYLKALVEISQLINSRSPDELLETIIDIAIRILEADRGFILLKDESSDSEFNPTVVRNLGTQQIHQVKDISHSTVQKVMRTGEPMLILDTFSDDQFDESKSMVLHQIRSIACVPLLVKGKLLGVIYIDSRGEKARLTRSSLEFLHAFANQAAMALQNASLMVQLQEENVLLKQQFHRIYAFKEIIGKSKSMQDVFSMMAKVLDNDSTVLITGETGTGKELVARAIHYNGNRKDHSFVELNCGAIPENLIESELFGHVKGAFTGAIRDKTGLVKSADSGTLFLDEVGELPLNLQVKVLRFLQNKEFTRVGDVKTRKSDVRIIAATNRDLENAIETDQFREDLFYRLNVINIQVPPLCKRKKDIPLLANHFIEKYCKKHDKHISKMATAALKKLNDYHWPGNVRELENTIERAIILDSDSVIDEQDLMIPLKKTRKSELEAGNTLEQVSKTLLQRTLESTDYNKTQTAELMKVSLRWVHYKMKEWGLV